MRAPVRVAPASCLALLATLLATLAPPAPAQSDVDPPTAFARDVISVRIDGLQRADLVELVARDFDVTSVRGDTAWLSLPVERLGELTALGHAPKLVPHPLDLDPSLAADYLSHAQLSAALATVAAEHPDICRLESLGPSVQGRELWILKISDNPELQEDEPEFRYVSSMHGDEVVGMQLCVRLIDELTDGYGNDPEITQLVDDVEIWILPLMNPDGREAGSRYNAQGVDLNRDFPDRVTDPVNTPAGRAVETQLMMNWGELHSPVLSANFHGGVLVVNYPYDSDPDPWVTYSACPDDALVYAQSLTYAALNGPMSNSPWFDDGVTNGVEWYTAHGGMQDWNYVWMGCNDVTIELGDNKWPPYAQLDGLWDDNRDAMLAYMQQCLGGVRGLATDAVSGQPVAATVTVTGIDHEVFADPDVGDYHRMLLPGTYQLRFSATGYDDVLVSAVGVGPGDATRLDVTLGAKGWSDLGSGLAGSGGQLPALTGAGPIVDGGVLQLALADALPLSSSYLVLGLGLLGAPFKGGTLVPSPDIVLAGLPVDANGELLISLTWPAGIPAGSSVYWQHWLLDAGGPAGFAASNGVRSTAQ